MAFAIDQEHLPATLNSHPMSDEEFAQLCSEHPDLLFEMSAEGELLVMPATYSIPGLRNAELNRQLGNWAIKDGRGVVSDSSTGFVLPNGARRSPDAAWTVTTRIAELDPASREAFWHLCPNFVIELRSPTDRLKTLHAKMQEWIDNGAELAWLIEPTERSLTIYRPAIPAETIYPGDTLAATAPAEGFLLQLHRIWDPLSA